MIEYKINTPAKLETVKKIWRKFLQEDNAWHFTLEGTYIELRVAKKMPVLEKYLREQKLDFISFTYKDNIDITRKYQKQFEKIFHGFACLSMTVDLQPKKNCWKTDLYRVLERCIHLAFNLHGFSPWEEAEYLALNAIRRAYMAGKLDENLKHERLIVAMFDGVNKERLLSMVRYETAK